MSVLIQSTASTVVAFLQLNDNTPATGLIFSDVTADLKKEGGGFISFTLTGSNFTELDNGYYEVALAAGDTDTLGSLNVRVQGGTIKDSLVTSLIVENTSSASTPVNAPPTTGIFGYLKNPDGTALENASVVARILSEPTVLNPTGDAMVISAERVTVKSDINGFFNINLITGSSVEIFISSANYRRQLLVPSASTNLFEIP